MIGAASYLPVNVGGIVYIMYSGIYYSVVLSNKMKSKYKDILENQSEGPFKYIYSVIIAFSSSFLMAILIKSIGSDNLLIGLGIGFIIGLIISMVYLKNAMFGLMSKRSFLITIGDHLIVFTWLGAIYELFL
ncbi:MAG: DUF1761 domain-containing protein [Bacillus sp. (in: firmicutes)]